VKNKKYIVSACLIGKNCRYDGDNMLNKRVVDLLDKQDYISVCPEELGGLKIPRPPAEIVSIKPGENIPSERRVLDRDKKDVTCLFNEGAKKTLEMLRSNGIKTAILKDKSPSCGSRFIYSGDFSGNLVEGTGITAALLQENGITVLDENNFEEKLELK
jgi:uncharacterized protein YbbK (DUF523 family)